MKPLAVTLAQLDFTVGAIARNADKIIATLAEYQHEGIVIFPELALTGYPPEDLLFRPDFEQLVMESLQRVADAAEHCVAVVGHPQRVGNELFNAISVVYKGEVLARYHKQRLPQYGVFDEQRYFIPDHQSVIFNWHGHRIGLLICEDLWHTDPLANLVVEGVDWVISVNASPYELHKHDQRMHVLQQRVSEARVGIVYVNNCGGQDELVFDGHSMIMTASGELAAELPHCQPCCATYIVNSELQWRASEVNCPSNHGQGILAEAYQALVLAVRDYVHKNGFKGVTIGLSGGIDSALTLAIAVEALGSEHVHAVMMPFRYTSEMSQEDAALQAKRLNVRYDIVAIEPMYDAFMQQLDPLLAGAAADITEQNIQARARGMLLMALSNKFGSLVLTTGNKSELAVGYCTLYGDMCGGFAPIKDIPKMMVFELARYVNRAGEVIPQRVIDRPPSAELAPDQKDEDNLPAYDVLDQILQLYVEQDWSPATIIDAGFTQEDVLRVTRLVDLNEYKRRQAAIGPKITARNFGKDRRYPITSHFRYELERMATTRNKDEKN